MSLLHVKTKTTSDSRSTICAWLLHGPRFENQPLRLQYSYFCSRLVVYLGVLPRPFRTIFTIMSVTFVCRRIFSFLMQYRKLISSIALSKALLQLTRNLFALCTFVIVIVSKLYDRHKALIKYVFLGSSKFYFLIYNSVYQKLPNRVWCLSKFLLFDYLYQMRL